VLEFDEPSGSITVLESWPLKLWLEVAVNPFGQIFERLVNVAVRLPFTRASPQSGKRKTQTNWLMKEEIFCVEKREARMNWLMSEKKVC
jgi:hypothetical protein